MPKWSRQPRICRRTWQPKFQRSCQGNAGHTLQTHFFTIHINVSRLIYHIFEQPLPVRFQCQTWVRILTLINEIQSQHESESTGPEYKTTSAANWLSQARARARACVCVCVMRQKSRRSAYKFWNTVKCPSMKTAVFCGFTLCIAATFTAAKQESVPPFWEQ
jgi:hypothetical protein